MNSCFIIDDEMHAIKCLEGYIADTPQLKLAGVSQHPTDALKIFSEQEYPDITFVDIDLPGISGIEVAELIKNKTKVVFTTAFPDFGAQAFDLEVYDYLLKPFPYARFLKCIYKIIPTIEHASNLNLEPEFFYIQGDAKGKLFKIAYQDILYVEGMKNYVSIITKNNKFITYLRLSEIETKLVTLGFLRVHKSYIINLNAISSISNDEIFTVDGKQSVPLGASYREIFFSIVNTNVIRTGRGKP